MTSSPAFADIVKPWAQISNAAQRFVVLTDFGGDAVLDRSTGLIWDRSPDGGARTWDNVTARCYYTGNGAAMPFDLGWRAPKAEELYSLFRVTGSSPGGPTTSLVPGHPFTMPAAARFWTATTMDGDPLQAWYASTSGTFGTTDKTDSLGVWCVRGGAN